MPTYTTNELEIASYLVASGHKLLDAQSRGRLVEFTFADSAEDAVAAYFTGAQLPARDLFSAHRSLRAVIQQVKSYRSGTDTWKQSELISVV